MNEVNIMIKKEIIIGYFKRPIFFVNFHIFLLLAYCFTSFSRNSGYLTRTYDIRTQSSYTEQAFRFKEFSFGVGNDLLRGLGQIDFPLQQKLIPEYLFSHLFTHDVNYALLFTVGSLELFLGTLFLSRSLKVSWNISLIASWVMALMAFGWTSVKIGSLFWLQPDYAHLISIGCFLIGLMTQITGDSAKKSVLIACACIFLLSWLFLSQPDQVILLLPVLTIFYLTLVLSNRPIWSNKTLHQAVILVATISWLAIFGFLSYLQGLVSYTAAVFFPNKLINERTDQRFISELLFGYTYGKRFFFIGLVGLVVAGARRIVSRNVLCGLVVTLLFVWTYGYLNTHSVQEIGPSANYIEHLIFPFFALGIGICLDYTFKLLFQIVASCNIKNIRFLNLNRDKDLSALLIPLFIFGVTLVWIFSTQDQSFKESSGRSLYPPVRTSITEILEDEIGLFGDNKYSGRVITITDPPESDTSNSPSDSTWARVHRFENFIFDQTGNEHRGTGFIYFGIPKISTYTQLLSPSFFRFSMNYLSFAQDRQIRNEPVLRRLDLDIFRMIGVRFVVSNREINDLRVRETIELPGNTGLFLYDIGAVNVGNYSPTKVVVSESLDESFGVIGNPDFDAKVTVVSDVDISGSFVPVSTSLISHKGNDLLVEGTSPGTSILLLPFEFSRCFDVTARSGEKPILFRANTLLTGVVFTGSVDVWLKYRTGPFHNSTCRIQDSKDFTKLLENKTNK